MAIRKIIHVDMDAFYASVEQRDNPDLRGKPVIVGGSPEQRGVVAACSYEARRYGVHSAMPSSRAAKICPHAVFLRPRFDAYLQASSIIRDIFSDYTELVEPLSLDEAYLDVTENKKGLESATIIAREIKARIVQETGLTASAGVSFNKFLAKVASDFKKPDGLTVVTPERAMQFIERLPIGKFHGVGEVTERRMKEIGIHTGADLRKKSRDELMEIFGKAGDYYYEIANARDDRPVCAERIRKSLGKETTFAKDLSERSAMLDILRELAEDVERSLKKRELAGRTVTLKVRYADFTLVTRAVTMPLPVDSGAVLMELLPGLLDKTEAQNRKARLLGITVSGFDEDCRPVQLRLPFEEDD